MTNVVRWQERFIVDSSNAAKFLLVLFALPLLLLFLLSSVSSDPSDYRKSKADEYNESIERELLESNRYYRVESILWDPEDTYEFPILGEVVLVSPRGIVYPAKFSFSISESGENFLELSETEIVDISYLSKEEVAAILRDERRR